MLSSSFAVARLMSMSPPEFVEAWRVDGCIPARIVPPVFMAVTYGSIFANVALPIPRTLIRSSGCVKFPFAFLYSIMRCAIAGPIPGMAVSSLAVARLMSMSPDCVCREGCMFVRVLIFCLAGMPGIVACCCD